MGNTCCGNVTRDDIKAPQAAQKEEDRAKEKSGPQASKQTRSRRNGGGNVWETELREVYEKYGVDRQIGRGHCESICPVRPMRRVDCLLASRFLCSIARQRPRFCCLRFSHGGFVFQSCIPLLDEISQCIAQMERSFVVLSVSLDALSRLRSSVEIVRGPFDFGLRSKS